MRRSHLMAILAVLILAGLVVPAHAIDDAHRAKANEVASKAIEYFRKHQEPDGSWVPKPGPAVTAMVASGMLDAGVPATDPNLKKAVDYILAQQKPSGAISGPILENYNTSIALMALGRLPQTAPGRDAAIAKATQFLKNEQWSEDSTITGTKVAQGHPYYGGAGYGKHGRPDLSNTAIMIAGLHDAGLNCNDPAYTRAMQFISKLQGSKANTTYGDKIVPDGGFIYTDGDDGKPGNLKTNAQPATTLDASGHSRLITYGSMTYAGFMSYLYAQLDKSDPRVNDAFHWVQSNYTVDENPRVGKQGYFYYVHLMARALHAYGEPQIKTADGKTHDWQNELIDKLASLQQPDGSFLNEKDRWMEGSRELDTAYALMAIEQAAKKN